MRICRWFLLSMMGVSLLLATAQEPLPANGTLQPPLTATEIVKQMEERNQQRASALRKFHGTRIYRMQYHGFPGSRDAEMTVELSYSAPDKKEFTVVSQSGSKFVMDRVFKKLLEGEQEAANPENQQRTALNSQNYDFTFAGTESTPLGLQYVLDVVPKSRTKFLYQGKVWIDAKDFAVTRIQAEPAKNPSFWIKKSAIAHRYVKVRDFWLPEENHTESWIRLGGQATLSIQYKDYQVLEATPLPVSSEPHENARLLPGLQHEGR